MNPKSRPFLTRTRRATEKTVDGAEGPAASLPPLKDISILYNLECKICINTYKIFYVENTEDLLVKRFRPENKMPPRKNSRKLLEIALKTKF